MTPVWCITSLDGSVNFRVQAETASDALNLLARSLDCTSFMAMCAELNYDRQSFTVAEIRDSRNAEISDNRDQLNAQRESAVTSAFKFLRRNAV